MSKKNDLTGAIYFSSEPPHLVGCLTIGGVEYELVGVRRSAIRADLTARRRDGKQPVQEDMFEGNDNGAE